MADRVADGPVILVWEDQALGSSANSGTGPITQPSKQQLPFATVTEALDHFYTLTATERMTARIEDQRGATLMVADAAGSYHRMKVVREARG